MRWKKIYDIYFVLNIQLVFVPFFILYSDCTVSAVNTTVSWQSVPAYTDFNQSSAFFIPKPFRENKRQNITNLLNITYSRSGVNLAAEARATLQDDDEKRYDTQFNEFYYDFTVAEQDLSIGKKRLSWGVGYGFRPLDVVQKENRRRLYDQTIEGVPLLSWDHFAASWALTVLYTPPSHGTFGNEAAESALALKYQTAWQSADIHSVIRISKENHTEIGGGFANVVNESLELHGSFLYQRRYAKRLNRLIENPQSPLLSEDPMQLHTLHNGGKALFGFTWTTLAGISLIGEMWYDKNAYSRRQWLALRDLTVAQQQLTGINATMDEAIYNNINANSVVFQQTSIQRQNLFLRISYEKFDWSSAIEGLVTPADNGWVVTAVVTQQGNNHRLQWGLRLFGGKSDSVYNSVNKNKLVYFLWRWTIPLL